MNDRAVKVGGIGGVKTHPAFRGRGFASTAIRQALDFFREQGEVDFALLVCEAGLVPFYERLGWRRFPGDLLVTQRQATVPFTLNLPMTTPIRLQEPLGGRIDLLGPLPQPELRKRTPVKAEQHRKASPSFFDGLDRLETWRFVFIRCVSSAWEIQEINI